MMSKPKVTVPYLRERPKVPTLRLEPTTRGDVGKGTPSPNMGFQVQGKAHRQLHTPGPFMLTWHVPLNPINDHGNGNESDILRLQA
jgi:hypothetical protein